jgi:hypothetical protein
MVMNIEPLSPKPASAGGELPLDELVELVKRARQQVPCGIEASDAANRCHSDLDSMAKRLRALRRKTIAAEADTAKPDQYAPLTDEELDAIEDARDEEIIFPSSDRLAPIEARGVVTDAEVERALDIWCNKPVTDDTNLPKSLRDRSRAVLEAFLRARESAPVVEPSVAAGCDGEADTTKPSIVDVELTEDFLTAASHAFWGACLGGGTQAGIAAVAKLAIAFSPQ